MTRMIKFVPAGRSDIPITEQNVGTKNSIHAIMSHYGNFTIGSHNLSGQESQYSGIVDRNAKFIYLFHAEKRRRKVIHLACRTNTGGLNLKAAEKYTAYLERKAHWKLRVFKFPLDCVVEAKQGKRSFTVVLK